MDMCMETRMYEVDSLEDNRKLYALAAEVLKQGELVAIPTETVYGLGADALNSDAVAKVFETKDRPKFDPLIVHLASARDLPRVARVPEALKELVEKLSREFWPGPFTMVLPKADVVPDIVTSGLDTVAVRVSAHPVMRGVVKALGNPIAAPSANRFGRISPTSAAAVMKELGGRIEMILDAGACSEGLESTIVRPFVDEKGKVAVELLREGPVTREQFRNLVKLVRKGKKTVESADIAAGITAPGQLPSHYAPGKKVLLLPKEDAFVPEQGVRYGLLTFEGDSPLADSCEWEKVYVLSPGSGRLSEAAVRLFALMRQMDEDDSFDVIVAETMPENGLGAAMMDRLRRASVSHD